MISLARTPQERPEQVGNADPLHHPAPSAVLSYHSGAEDRLGEGKEGRG